MRRTLARIGLDLLLAMHPDYEVMSVDYQRDGPWLLATLGLASDNPDAFAFYPFAIWRETGAVYGITNGAVHDDPLWTP